MATYKRIYSYSIKALCILLCTGCWWLPVLSFAFTPSYPASHPPVFIEPSAPAAVHLVLRQNVDYLQLWTQAGELLTSQAQAQKVIINNPHIKSLTLDFRSGYFNIPVIYHGNRQQTAQLIIQGGHFSLLENILQNRHSGYLDLDNDGHADVQYNNVAEVHLLVEADSEIRIATPEPYAPTRMQRQAQPPQYRISSQENAFPTTVVPVGRTITLFNPALI